MSRYNHQIGYMPRLKLHPSASRGLSGRYVQSRVESCVGTKLMNRLHQVMGSIGSWVRRS